MTASNHLKLIATLIAGFGIAACSDKSGDAQLASSEAAPSFSDVWAATKQGPYAPGSLEKHVASYGSFFDGAVNLLERAVARTLSSQADTLPRFQKLLHPIGICFAGTWDIDVPNRYSGYFKAGSHAQIIMRASEAFGNPTAENWRAFGLAGKIFPADGGPRTANFFTIDDLGGTDSASFLDDPKSNEPATSVHFGTLAILRMALEVNRVFSNADSNPGVRQLYPVAELGLPAGAAAVTPEHFSLKSENGERSGEADFRNELRLHHFFGQKLVYSIMVSDGAAEPAKIGQIVLTDEALSDGCDHVLHFPHPRTR
jgi:hypothetical protein